MVSTSEDLDARLRRHHKELVDLFSAHRVIAPARRRKRSRRLLAGLALAISVAVSASVLTLRLAPSPVTERQEAIAGITVTVAAGDALPPRMSRQQAITAAEAFFTSHPMSLPHGGGVISGLSVTGTWFVADVQHVTGPCVNVFLQRPTNVWFVAVTAPAQSGWNQLRGAFLVDDVTGNLAGGDLLIGPSREQPICS